MRARAPLENTLSLGENFSLVFKRSVTINQVNYLLARVLPTLLKSLLFIELVFYELRSIIFADSVRELIYTPKMKNLMSVPK